MSKKKDEGSLPPPADEDKAELEPKPASSLPSDAAINAAVCNPNQRVGDHVPGHGPIAKRFQCRGAGAGLPVLYIAATVREDAEALYRRMHGLDYHAHVAVFVETLPD